jgi:uncharacterized membrane protein YdjX (TVP38/TMEM64 family)
MNLKSIKIALVVLLMLAIAVFLAFDLQQYATLDYIKGQQSALQDYYHQHTFLVLAIFSLAYTMIIAFSLPAATAMTFLAGALFGFFTGLIMASFASSVGATFAFLMARFLLKNTLQEKYGNHLKKINEGFTREGAFYLFALRLVPVFPFFIINVVIALMPIKTWTFYWVSQLGMLPGTIVYVYAGTQLAQIETFSDITSPSMLIAFALLGLFPLITKNFVQLMRKDKSND